VRPSNIWHLYRVRLRARALQECFAIAGIAAGVALLFSSQVASSSLLSSVAQLSRGIVGHATLQLLARDAHGFPEATLTRVRRTPGVKVAAPLLEASANARGPKGSESVELVGADASLAQLGGALVRHTALQPFGGIGAVVLPAPVSRTIGVRKFGQEVTLDVAGRSAQAPLYAQLHASQIGPLVASPIAVGPLSFVQEMTGLGGRVSRILVQPAHGRGRAVRAALARIAAGRLNVEPTDHDERLFAKAAAATNQSTQLFALISALVGFLFAFNAMLLTVPQRRRLIVELRRDGYTPRTVICVLLLDAILLGLVAGALGLVLGDELSIHLFRSAPGYLSSAFAVGSQRVVGVQSVAVALGGGMAAAVVAVLSPLRDILSRDPLAAGAPRERDRAGDARAHGMWLALAALACLGAATLILLVAPAAAIAGMALLVAALLLALPLMLGGTLGLVRRLAPRFLSATPHVAAMELSAARARAIAIAATGAIAVFASVAIQGAHGDLLGGLEGAAHDMNAFTDVWVAPAGSYNLLKTTPFTPVRQQRLARLPGVRAVRIYRGGFLDFGERRVWAIAPPRDAVPLLPPSQILEGGVQRAQRLMRAGGWVVLSKALAAERHLRIGDALTLPSPVPLRVRVAALSTNIGWAPGALIMNAADFARASGSRDASAYNVLLAPGVPVGRGVGEITRALGPDSGLAVESAEAHADRQRTLSRQGLARLSQIATLIMLGAVLAMAAAMGTMVWQRRPRLAKLRLEGFARAELWRMVLLESALLLGVGCASGALLGLYGQQLLDRALANVINFPVVHSVALVPALVSLAVVALAAGAAIALPGYLAAGVSPAVALED
jgi:putative ABC transport system permease protein